MNYPNSPGFKECETSSEAAEAIHPTATTLRMRVLAHIKTNPGMTADQIADALGESILSVRPRISELRKLHAIYNDGRGQNISGMSAHRWCAA